MNNAVFKYLPEDINNHIFSFIFSKDTKFKSPVAKLLKPHIERYIEIYPSDNGYSMYYEFYETMIGTEFHDFSHLYRGPFYTSWHPNHSNRYIYHPEEEDDSEGTECSIQ